MTTSNKKRLFQNLALIAIIAGLAVFLWAQQQADRDDKSNFASTLYDKSIGDEATEILIHVEGREDILLKSINNIWMVVQPEEFIADKEQVQHLFTILSENAEASYDLKDKDLAQYGLDEDRLSISFNNVKLVFGEYNAVSHKRYIRKAEKMYLVSETITGLLQAGVDAFRMKDSSNEGILENTN
ncbi:MAG: hypothetical protein ACI88H_001726 [Cocleimonas sp.]|jgi:hypothetical protein